MATERQIEANRRNACRSCGPRSASGKARSCLNATRHGLAGVSAGVEAGLSPEFAGRRARWAAEQQPVGEAANWALDRAVAASLQIERCERAMEGVVASARERASLAWDEDRAVEAASVAARLGLDPVLVSRQLRATLAGVEILVEAWLGLVATLEAGADWSEPEASRALDLLGVASDLRSGRSPVDAFGGVDPVAFRRELAFEELDRLEALRDEAMVPLDESERRRAMVGDVALLSKSAKLVFRYERDAWRRYRESIKQVHAPAPPPVVDVLSPSPAVASRPEARERAVVEPSITFEEERRAVLAESAALRSEFPDSPASMGLDDEDAWLDELERRIEAMPDAPGRSGPVADGVGHSRRIEPNSVGSPLEPGPSTGAAGPRHFSSPTVLDGPLPSPSG